MDEKILLYKIDGSMFRRNIRNIHSLKDMYKNMTADCDISNIKIDNFLETKRVFEWILEHPEYDYKTLIESDYSNEMLYNYFKIYYEDIIFTLDKYFSGDYLIRLSEIENM